MSKPILYEPGQQVGDYVVVVRLSRTSEAGNLIWLCQCLACGREWEIPGIAIRSRPLRSCGCQKHVRRSNNFKHGHTWPVVSKEYGIWGQMISRCHNPKVKCFPDYGGRGIKVCDRWRYSFENFIADVGPRPSPKHSLDRKDNDGDYCPENCRWATRKDQGNNTRKTRFITANGITQSARDWSLQTGVERQTILSRLQRGWTPERALELGEQRPLLPLTWPA